MLRSVGHTPFVDIRCDGGVNQLLPHVPRSVSSIKVSGFVRVESDFHSNVQGKTLIINLFSPAPSGTW